MSVMLRPRDLTIGPGGTGCPCCTDGKLTRAHLTRKRRATRRTDRQALRRAVVTGDL